MAIFKWMDLAVLAPAAFIAGILNIRYSMSTYFVEGLTQYVPTGQNSISALAATTSNKKKKKGEKESAGLGDAENIIPFGIPRTQVESSAFYQVLDNLTFMTTIVLLCSIFYTAVAHMSYSKALALSEALFRPAPIIMAIGLVSMALVALSKVHFFSAYSSAEDKGYVLLFGLAGFLASTAVFAFEQKKGGAVFAWSADLAAQGMGGLIQQLASKAAPGLPVEEAVQALTPSPLVIRIFLSFVAAAISGLFLAPAGRFVRAYRLQQEPPAWAQNQIKSSVVSSMKFAGLLVLPAISALTWTGPLFNDVFGLNSYQAEGVRAGVAVWTGFMFLFSCRVVLQRYLDTALIAWYTYKLGARKSSTERAIAAEIIQHNASAVRRLVVKAAVQILAVGVFFLGCGLALGVSWANPVAHAGLQVSKMIYDTQKVISCLAGFCIWWAAINWVLYVGGAMWLFRTGILRY